MRRSHPSLRGLWVALLAAVALLTANETALAQTTTIGECGIRLVDSYPRPAGTIAAATRPPTFKFTANVSPATEGRAPGDSILVIPDHVLITDGHGGNYDDATPFIDGASFDASFTGSRGNAWWTFPGTYYIEFLIWGTRMVDAGGVFHSCLQTSWPVIAFTVTAPSVPPPATVAPPEKDPAPDLTFLEANRAAAQLVHLRAPGASRLMRACTRRSPARFRCGMNWRDRRYRWKGIATFTALDAKTIGYRFLGSRTRIKCRKGCTQGVLWESG